MGTCRQLASIARQMPGDDDNRDVQLAKCELLKQTQAGAIGQIQIGDHQIGGLVEHRHRLLQRVRFSDVNVRASDVALADARKHLSNREIVELILMAGFYTTLARLTETLGVETEAPMGSALIRQIEKRVAANKARA